MKNPFSQKIADDQAMKSQAVQNDKMQKEREMKVMQYRLARVDFDLKCFEIGLQEQVKLNITDDGIMPGIALGPSPEGEQGSAMHVQLKKLRKDLYLMAGQRMGIPIPDDLEFNVEEDVATEKQEGIQ